MASEDTVRGHLRAAVQALNLVEYEAGDRGLPLERARQHVSAAAAIAEQVATEASLHPFAFARHVGEVL